MAPLLRVEGLNVAFRTGGQTRVCAEDVEFSVDPGEVLCVVGESGCGKSVTALSILGLLAPNARVTGRVLFEGVDLLTMGERDLDRLRGKDLAMVFQDVMNSLNPVFTVGNQLVETIRTHLHFTGDQARSHAVELLAKVGMPDPAGVMKKYPHTLSGGMRQRAMIAMALACRPKLIIADEPTTALDVTIQWQILRLLLSLRDEFQMSIVLITHDLGLVAEIADRVLVMYAGQCVEEAPVYALFDEPAHPYTQALLAAVPGLERDGRELFSIPGTIPEDYHTILGCRFAERCRFAAEACRSTQAFGERAAGHRVRCRRALASVVAPPKDRLLLV